MHPPPPPTNAFGAAMRKILSRELHVPAAAGPVLSKRRTAGEKAIAAERAAARARRVAAATRAAATAARNPLPSASTLDTERTLRRVATKGVVALFNAIAKHQRATEAALEEPLARTAQLSTVAAKQASFLGLLQGAKAAAAAGGGGAGGGGAAWLKPGFAQAVGTAMGGRAAALAEARHDEGVAAHLLDSDGGSDF